MSRARLSGINDAYIIEDDIDKEKYDATVAALLSIHNLECVEYVIMDFDRTYAKAVRDVFSDLSLSPTIIIDLRHGLECVRRPMATRINRLLSQKLDVRGAGGVRLNSRKVLKLLNSRPHKLKPQDRAHLREILDNYPQLAAPYRVKEEFYRLFVVRGEREEKGFGPERRQLAERRYRAWVDGIPADLRPLFQKAISNIAKRHNEVFAYFESGYTGAATEMRQGGIRTIYREGRGCGFKTLRNKVLAKFGNWTEDRIDQAIEAVMAGKPPLPRLSPAPVVRDEKLQSTAPQEDPRGLPLFSAGRAA